MAAEGRLRPDVVAVAIVDPDPHSPFDLRRDRSAAEGRGVPASNDDVADRTESSSQSSETERKRTLGPRERWEAEGRPHPATSNDAPGESDLWLQRSRHFVRGVPASPPPL